MARELYIPVNGFSERTEKFYIPLDEKSVEVVKGYCSVNGYSKLFYEKRGVFWFFYETLANKTCQRIDGRSYYKRQNGIAFYAVTHHISRTGNWFNPLYMSTDEDAVRYWTSSGGTTFPHGSIEYNGETWYWEGNGYGFVNQTYSPVGCFVDLGNNRIDSMDEWIGKAADILMPNIYANDFAKNFRKEADYDIYIGDKEKTIRKLLAIFLYKNVTLKNETAYSLLLNNIDLIVGYINTDTEGYDKIFADMYFVSSGAIFIDINLCDRTATSTTILTKITEGGYTYCDYTTNWVCDKWLRIGINDDLQGRISHTLHEYRNPQSLPSKQRKIGVFLTKYSETDTWKEVILSNFGLNL